MYSVLCLLPEKMSGLEAAASLFGSEDSVSDPFTTLGTNTASTNPFDELFFGNIEASSGISDSNISNDSAFYTNDAIHSRYSDPSRQNLGHGHDLYNHSEPQVAGQNSSASWDQSTVSHTINLSEIRPSVFQSTDSAHLTAAHPPASLSTTDYSHTNGPQEYTPQVANTKQPPVATPVYGNNYTPQSYASASTYAPYTPYNAPAHPSYPPPPPPIDLPASNYQPPLSSTNTVAYPSPPPASVIPKPPPPPSILTRQKLNAYDPPFLPTKSHRRTGRTAPDTHETILQPPVPPVPYASDTAVSNAYAGSYYQTNTLFHHEKVGQASSDIPSVQSYSTGPPPGPFKPQPHPESKSALYQNSARSLGAETPAPHESYPEHVTPSTIHSNGHVEHYNQERKFSLPETTRSHTPRSSSIGSNSSLPKSDKARSPPGSTSPSMIPLPYSPRGLPTQAASNSSSDEYSLAKTPPQYSSHVSPQLTRKTFINDPYVPAVRGSNHIPRQYLPSDSGKVPAALNLAAVGAIPHDTTQRDMTVPFKFPESDMSVNTSFEGLSPRQAIGIHDSTRQPLGQYAPSPSLVGANDPLSRTSSRAPVVTFGFGGKMITCFHGMPGLNAGFDVALSARTSSELKVRILQKILPESVLLTPAPSYPGPLVSDPGTASLSLVRSVASSQAKAKKSGLTTYLTGRVEEISQGLGFLSHPKRQHAENKLILVKLLKALVENEGRFFGLYVTSGMLIIRD